MFDTKSKIVHDYMWIREINHHFTAGLGQFLQRVFNINRSDQFTLGVGLHCSNDGRSHLSVRANYTYANNLSHE
jgi:hypothetical protein